MKHEVRRMKMAPYDSRHPVLQVIFTKKVKIMCLVDIYKKNFELFKILQNFMLIKNRNL